MPTRRRAAFELATFAAIVAVFVAISAYLLRHATHAPLGVDVGLVSLGFLAPSIFFAFRDGAPAAALGVVRPLSWGRELQVAAATAIGAYGVAAVVTTTYLGLLALARHASLVATMTAEATATRQWTKRLAEVPLSELLAIAVFAGIYEEIVFRGFVLGRLRIATAGGTAGGDAGWRRVACVVVAAVAFGLGHGYQGPLGIAKTTALGVVFGFVALARSSVWATIVAHVAIDVFAVLVVHALP